MTWMQPFSEPGWSVVSQGLLHRLLTCSTTLYELVNLLRAPHLSLDCVREVVVVCFGTRTIENTIFLSTKHSIPRFYSTKTRVNMDSDWLPLSLIYDRVYS